MSDSYGAGDPDSMAAALMKDSSIDQQYQNIMNGASMGGLMNMGGMNQPGGLLQAMQGSSRNFMNPMGGMLGHKPPSAAQPGGLLQALQGLFNPNTPSSPTTPSSSPTGQMPPTQ